MRVKRLFWDLEVSPNIAFSWRAGAKQFISHDAIIRERAIICVCWKWEHQKTVYSLEWNAGDDKTLCEEFLKVALQADELIAQNGDRFDVRWFNTRCLFHRLPPAPAWKTVDTLAIAKKRFLFNSNRLDYMGKFLLGQGKAETDYQMWTDICLHNSKKQMKRMVDYCKDDVRLLQEVWELMQPWHGNKTHSGVHLGLEKWTCPHCASENVKVSKTTTTAHGTVKKQMKCGDCGRYYSISMKAYEGYLNAFE